MHASLTVKVSSFNIKLSEIYFCQSPFFNYKMARNDHNLAMAYSGCLNQLNLTLWPLYKAQRVLSDKTSFSTSASEQWGEQDKRIPLPHYN